METNHTRTASSDTNDASGMYEALMRQFRESERTAPRTTPTGPDEQERKAEKLTEPLKQAAKQ